MRPALAVVDAAFGDAELEAAAVREAGFDVRYLPTTDDRWELDPHVQGVMVRRRRVTARDIAAMRHVRVIGRYGSGIDLIDVDSAREAGIGVVRVSDYCSEEVGQHALALLLAAWRHIGTGVVSGPETADWTALGLDGVRPTSDCVLGVVGAGRTGRELIRQAGHLFGEVVVWDPSAGAPAGTSAAASLHDLLRRSDAVTLHCPLDVRTRHLLDAAAFAEMREGSVLVNVSRGGVVDADALLDALADGRPSRAALDVLDGTAPEAVERLRAHPQVVVTPHVAWYSTRSILRLRSELAVACAGYLRGEPVPGTVADGARTGEAR